MFSTMKMNMLYIGIQRFQIAKAWGGGGGRARQTEHSRRPNLSNSSPHRDGETSKARYNAKQWWVKRASCGLEAKGANGKPSGRCHLCLAIVVRRLYSRQGSMESGNPLLARGHGRQVCLLYEAGESHMSHVLRFYVTSKSCLGNLMAPRLL